MVTLNEIGIRSLHTTEELENVRKLESKIWGEEDSIPTHQTITSVKNGGLVLGAYLNEQLVGFQYSFPGFNGKEVYLCSHILGIDEEFRNKKIGEKLKLAQREEGLKLGYSQINWTYDPLESINGYLNIAKLGGVCSTYLENCYGEMEDLLNSGIPSDRFLVEWHIRKENSFDTTGEQYEQEYALQKSVIQWEVKEGLPIPSLSLSKIETEYEPVFVAIPKNFRAIKEKNLDIANEWRMKTREIFTKLFQEGWQVTGFKKNTLTDIPVQYYIVTKK
ncbi:GNAT family N-acetyltransferase [Bacillus sp. RG28]|uniref:GNAT family N-acetyltransferase n=1 Tax=Gottfriedia endophytica TaxID=2820819 RepID=A0A940NPM0_9BACI|nr:GNAT family N-acetyltransferase [Gottfriedia endophytica]MBP0726456.1 GNAT family N-acetyltransferase [Gottfriedia endophytica]